MARDEFEVFKDDCLDRLWALDAPGSVLRVATYLLRFANRDHFLHGGETEVWPSLDKISHKTNLTRSATNRALKWLKEVGFFYCNSEPGYRTLGRQFLEVSASGDQNGPRASGDQNGPGGRPRWH